MYITIVAVSNNSYYNLCKMYSLCIMFVDLHFVISESNKRIFSDDYEVRKGTSSICIPLQHTVALTGDIRVEFYNYRPKMKRKVHIYAIFVSIYLMHDKLINRILLYFPGKDVSFLV